MSRIYLDWNATAPLLEPVQEAMREALGHWGNASSIHMEGQVSRALVERARRALAAAIGAPAQSVILTGGATESNNQVLNDFVIRQKAGVACLAVEHPSVLEVVDHLSRGETATSIIPVDAYGRLEIADVEAAINAGAGLVSVMLANNEIGNVYPVAQVAGMAHERGVLVHTDATQAIGRMPIDFEALGVDLMTLSFHKMGGPKGIGAVVVREGLKVEATLFGGHQERGRRPGTENVIAAAGLEAACKLVKTSTPQWQAEMEYLRAQTLERLGQNAGFSVRGDQDARLPNTINMAFEGLDGEDLLLALDLDGLALSSGSACTAGSLEPSHVVLAMGFDQSAAKQSVRLSFGPTTRAADLERACEVITSAVDRLRGI